MNNKKRILLVQLFSNGDCLYATVIARQIKEVDYPGCHLTWAVNKGSSQSVKLNPYVDEIWEVPVRTLMNEKEWIEFKLTAEDKRKEENYDLVFYTQVIAENTLNFDGGIRSSLYNNYPHPISVSQQPVLRLGKDEVETVSIFAARNKLKDYNHVLLVECGPQSFESSLNPAGALSLAKMLVSKHPDMAVILSSNSSIETNNDRIIDGSVLNFRANAELTKYCTLFIGCSSGISWIATSDWAKPLPMILITDDTVSYASSMTYDHKYSGLPVDHIIEIQESAEAINTLSSCISTVISDSFGNAKEKYHREFKRKNYRFVYTIARSSFERWDILGPMRLPAKVWKRNGFNGKVISYLLKAYLKLPVFLFKNIFGMNK